MKAQPFRPKTEVLVPGGSLDHALWALEGGADAVYVGYQKFSARSHADNLSLDDISALTATAKSKGARIFVATNIILSPAEIEEALPLAWQLYWRGVDALIIQDLGLGEVLRRFGPPLDLHASTQAAVHNISGVKAIQALGYKRVVLARELTLPEIGEITRAVPDMEYEVFVHGALCYAVSGNCMASGLMLGRSANRGDCGQICRTKFELDYLIPGPKRRESPHEAGLPAADAIHAPPGEITWKHGTVGAFTSMNDLELGSRIRELRALGVNSFKIEGRMKPPAYSYNTARAYKAFLEGGRDAEAWSWLDEARVRFGRLPSTGWFDGHKALAQTNPAWASTLGMPLGTIAGGQDKTIRVPNDKKTTVFKTLAKGDGVMLIGPVAGQTLRVALAGPVTTNGPFHEITLADKLTFDPQNGTLWLLSRHDGKLPVKKPGKPYRHPVDLHLTLTPLPAKGPATVVLAVSTTAFLQPQLSLELQAQPAQSGRGPEASLTEIFTASDSLFHPGKLTLTNQVGAVFLPPKQIKEFRRQWYALLEQSAESFLATLPETLRTQTAALTDYSVQLSSDAPVRALLSPVRGVNKLTGFVTEWEGLTTAQLATTPWGLSLPLAPFTPQEDLYFNRLLEFAERCRSEGKGPLFLGLNNPGHLTWLARLRESGLDLPHWYADWGFHSANAWTPVALAQTAPGLQFAIHWLEDPVNPDRSYFPPLFTSRACMLRNSFGDQAQHLLSPKTGHQAFDSRDWTTARQAGQTVSRPAHGPRCPDSCAGHFSARLVQGKKSFRVEARDCINYLILEDDSRPQ